MRGTLDLRRLRYFLAIAEHGSLSAAARALNLAQPALSYHVAELERLTGLVLFTRKSDGVDLTEAGRVLRRHAREIIEKVDAAERALEKLARPAAPTTIVRMRIAIISSLAAVLTPLLAARVGLRLPDVSLHIIEAGTRDIELKLGRGEADMAVYLVSTHGPGERPLATEQLFFLDAAAPGEEGEGITLAALAGQPLILPARGNPLRDFMDGAAERAGLDLNVVLEVDGSRSRRNAVLNGIGGTVLGAQAVAGEGRNPGLHVREIVEPRLYRPIYLGVRRDLDPDLRDRTSDLLREALIDLGLDAPRAG